MTKIETLNKAYITKLEETNSHDKAILHVAWLAYQDGVKSMGGEVTESHSRYFDDMLGNPIDDLNKLSIKDDGWNRWHGHGDCPVDPNSMVEILKRSGEKIKIKAIFGTWEHLNYPFDIIAYKVMSSA